MASLHPPPSISPDRPAGRPLAAWQRWLYFYAPPALLMLVIFIASTDVGSSQHSGRVISGLLAWLGLDRRVTLSQLDLLNHYVRKLGHVSEYALLAALLHRAFLSARANSPDGRSRWAHRAVLPVLAVVALYAASDEFHQVFVAGRTPSVWDVLLDITGGAGGLLLKRVWEERWKARRSG